MMIKLTLRNLAAHKLRLVLTAMAVVLGVTFVSGSMIFSATMERTILDLFAAHGAGTDTVVRADDDVDAALDEVGGERPLASSLLSTVEGVAGVEKVHGSVTGYAAVLDKHGKLAGKSPRFGTDWVDDPDFSVRKLVEGRGPRSDDEIVLDKKTANAAGYRVGDHVTVVVRSGKRTVTLTGIFGFGSAGAGSSAAITAFAPATAQRLLMEQPGTFRELDVHAKDGVEQEKLRDDVAAALPAGFEAITGEQAFKEQADEAKELLGLLQKFLLVFAAIAMFVASFIIFNTFSMLVAQRTREMALLRAIGADRSQVTRGVLGEAIGVGLVGSVFGLLFGALLSKGLQALFGAVGLDIPSSGLTIPGRAVYWSCAVGLGVTVLAAYAPARRASAIPPIAALRSAALPTARSLRGRTAIGSATLLIGAVLAGVGLSVSGNAALVLTGLGGALALVGCCLLIAPIGIPATRVIGKPFAALPGAFGKLSRENAGRDPRRTAATASALMIGLTLISLVSVIAASLDASVDRQLDAGVRADYRITAQGGQLLDVRTRAAVTKTPGVTSVVATRAARFRLAGKTRTATAGNPRELVDLYRLKLESGNASPGRDELLVSRSTADAEGWTVGSTAPGDYRDGTTATFRISGIYSDVKTIVETVPEIVIDFATYKRHEPAPLYDRLDVITSNGEDQAAHHALQTSLAPWPNLDLEDKAAIKSAESESINLILRLVLALLTLSVVIAALGVVNTLALSVVERTREIGLLRAVGMQRRQVRRTIRYEAVIISVYGTLFGIVVGVVLGVTVQNSAAGEGIEVLSIPFGQLALYALGGAVIGVGAAIWPARRAARISVLQAIATH